MKYEAVAQFTVTGGSGVKSVRDLLDKYGLDYVILGSSGTGILQPLTYEIAILKPEPTAMTPDRLFSFMMKFDEIVRIGKSTHALTPAQIDFAKSCDKAKLLKFLDGIWYQVKDSYVKVIAMLAQAYSIAYDKPDSNSGEKTGADEMESSVLQEGTIDKKEITEKLISIFPKEMIDEFMLVLYNMSNMDKTTCAEHEGTQGEKKGE